MRPSIRGRFAMRTGRSLRTVPCVGLAAVLVFATAACGKKGPPLAPFVRVPAAVSGVTPQRIGDDVYLSFAVPSTNADGQKPASISGLEIYAVTADRPPETEKQRELATLIATLPVRAMLPAPPPNADGTAPPPIPMPPGVEQGASVAVREALTADTRVPVELPVEKPIFKPTEPVDTGERIGPLVAPAATQLPRRHYFVVGISARGRESAPSTPVSIPLEAGSSAPGAPVISNTETTMTITWTPSPDARTSTFLLPPTVKPVPGAANATPSNTTPRVPPPLPRLTAKSLGFNSTATTYHVYDVTPPVKPLATSPAAPPATPPDPAVTAEDPFAIKPPAAITPAPVADTEYVLKAVAFDLERCFQVRAVDQVFGTTVIGPPSPTGCFTPKDTFPPVAPKSLQAIAGSGVISLIWDPNPERDLAGYIVLRGEAPGDTLQAITPQPVTTTSYRDESVRPGTRYVYAIVAVDRAVPQNVSPQSNRAEETARQ